MKLRKCRFLSITGSLLLCSMAIAALPAMSQAEALVVPAYFYPGTGGPGGVGDGWEAMARAASRVPLVAIFNPDSGPAPGEADPSYVKAMAHLEDSGGKVVAYVWTGGGSVPLATVESQVDTYISQYGHLIQGFLLDGVLITPGTLSYYQSAYGYIKSLSPFHLVIGNSGQPWLNGVSPAQYLSTADISFLFEGTETDFADYPFGQNWEQSYSRRYFGNTIYDVPASDLLTILQQAVNFHAGALYITDQSGSNPYAELPTYWDQEVKDIARSWRFGHRMEK